MKKKDGEKKNNQLKITKKINNKNKKSKKDGKQ
jgi:hypothetical protein